MPPPIKYTLRKNRFSGDISYMDLLGVHAIEGDIYIKDSQVLCRTNIKKNTVIGYLSPNGRYFASLNLAYKKKSKHKHNQILCYQLKNTGECVLSSLNDEYHFSLLIKWSHKPFNCNVYLNDDSSISTICDIEGSSQHPLPILGFWNNFKLTPMKKSIPYKMKTKRITPSSRTSQQQPEELPSSSAPARKCDIDLGCGDILYPLPVDLAVVDMSIPEYKDDYNLTPFFEDVHKICVPHETDDSFLDQLFRDGVVFDNV